MKNILRGLLVMLALSGCGESLEDRATRVFIECANEFGLDGGMVGVVRGLDGGFAVTTPALPEPAATECSQRLSAVLQD